MNPSRRPLGRVRSRALCLALSLIFPLTAAGCGEKPPPESGDGTLRIVATTTMLYDLTVSLAGEHAQVSALMGPGVDPHLYEASAGDVKCLQEADVVVYHGLHLEGKMDDVFAGLTRQGRRIICAEDGIDPADLLSDQQNPAIFDPHVWFDVRIWMDVADYTARRLMEIDPGHGEDYRSNLEFLLEELEELDCDIRDRAAELPEGSRILVTAHDAFRYFGTAYGFEVRGLQGISTDAEAGTADVRYLADFIVQSGVRAIFVESSVPPKNIEALQAAVEARGASVSIGGQLYSDSLGDEASGCPTYSAACRANIDTIVDALR